MDWIIFENARRVATIERSTEQICTWVLEIKDEVTYNTVNWGREVKLHFRMVTTRTLFSNFGRSEVKEILKGDKFGSFFRTRDEKMNKDGIRT